MSILVVLYYSVFICTLLLNVGIATLCWGLFVFTGNVLERVVAVLGLILGCTVSFCMLFYSPFLITLKETL